MSKKYNINVEYRTGYFDIEITDEEIEEAKRYGIDVEDEEELVRYHLKNNFIEHEGLLTIEDFDFEEE